MDTLFHFVFGFIAGMAVNVRLRHRPLWVAGVALAAVLIDMDHLIFAYSRTFHTLFVTVLIPALLFYAAYRYERGTGSVRYQSLVILFFVMLNGHLVADLFGSDLKLFYPLSDAAYGVPAAWKIAFLREEWLVVGPDGVALALYGLIIAAAYYAEETIYLIERQHETLTAAIHDAVTA